MSKIYDDEEVKAIERPWDRLEKESAKHFEWFTYYRHMGTDKSHKLVAENFKVKHETIRNIASRYKWTIRNNAFQEHLSQETAKAREKDVLDKRIQHDNYMNAQISVLMAPTQEFMRRYRGGNIDWTKFTDKELLEACRLISNPLTKMIEVQRATSGEASEVIQHNHKIETIAIVPQVSTKDIRALSGDTQ